MVFRKWLKPPRHLFLMFFGITVISASALAWLSWQLVRQDRILAQNQDRERHESAVRLVEAALHKNLSELEERLTFLANLPNADFSRAAGEFTKLLPEDSALISLQSGELLAFPSNHILYYPSLPKAAMAPAGIFAEADALEAREKDYLRAAEVLDGLRHSADLKIRAEALSRLGRNFRRAGKKLQAAAAYRELVDIKNVQVSPGLPADLVARVALLSLADSAANRRTESLKLYDDLNRGPWLLDQSTYEGFVNQLKDELGTSAPTALPSTNSVALTDAVGELWKHWQTDRNLNGPRTKWLDDRSLLLVERGAAQRTVALIAGPRFIETNWVSDVNNDLNGFNVALADAAGHSVVGNTDTVSNGYPLLLGADTQPLWYLFATSSAKNSNTSGFSLRTQLVIGGVCAIALLVIGGTYLIGRSVARELAVARQQSDFVSAVSHEFRSPLTAMRQLSELLVQDRIPSDDMRRQFYKVLEQESGRLHRLVEGLLKFGRIEADAAKYEFGAVDTTPLLQSLIKDFSREAERQGCQVELHTAESLPSARADHEALSCVIWNLLDNAVKYSPDCRTVWVDNARENGRVAIRVKDKGVGIPKEDQKRIFEKFVRGDNAKELAIPGTGIGLSVARQIIVKHGGEIRLESEPGTGSTFTVLLPAVES